MKSVHMYLPAPWAFTCRYRYYWTMKLQLEIILTFILLNACRIKKCLLYFMLHASIVYDENLPQSWVHRSKMPLMWLLHGYLGYQCWLHGLKNCLSGFGFLKLRWNSNANTYEFEFVATHFNTLKLLYS